ncbi:MAG: LexA family protein [Bacillota bacterium]
MFNKLKFKNLVQKSIGTRSKTQYANESGVNRTYISKIINQKLDNPPSPAILRKLANNSQGRINYKQLMEVTGYLQGINLQTNFNSNIALTKVPIVKNIQKDIVASTNIKDHKIITTDKSPTDLFYFEMTDNSMLNSGITNGSLVLIEQQATIENSDIAAITLNYRGLIAKVFFYDHKIILLKDDSNPKIINKSEIEFIGKCIQVTSQL